MRVSNANLLDPVAIARWMIEREFIRQLPLKSLQEFNRLVRDLGVGLSPWSEEDTQHLWQLGILRADFRRDERAVRYRGNGLHWTQQRR